MSSINVNEAKDHFAEVIRATVDDDVILLDEDRPIAVVMSVERHEALLDELDDLRDTVDIMRSDPDEEAIPLEQVISDLDAQAS